MVPIPIFPQEQFLTIPYLLSHIFWLNGSFHPKNAQYGLVIRAKFLGIGCIIKKLLLNFLGNVLRDHRL